MAVYDFWRFLFRVVVFLLPLLLVFLLVFPFVLPLVFHLPGFLLVFVLHAVLFLSVLVLGGGSFGASLFLFLVRVLVLSAWYLVLCHRSLVNRTQTHMLRQLRRSKTLFLKILYSYVDILSGADNFEVYGMYSKPIPGYVKGIRICLHPYVYARYLGMTTISPP